MASQQTRHRNWIKQTLSNIELALLHQGVTFTFVFVYSLLNLITFFVGASPAWRRLAEEKFIIRAATALARAGGAMLNLNSVCIIFVASRTLMTALRQTILNMFVPFDKAMPAFHSLIGNFLFAATWLHTIAHAIRYCVRNLWGPGLFGASSLFISGCILTTIVTAMRITSLIRIRRKSFESFFWVHYIGFMCFYVLLIIHGSHNGAMKSWMYVTLPLAIYIIDRGLRLAREQGSRLSISRESAVVKDTDMVCLRIPRTFSYLAGQYCDIKVPCVSNMEWHPFTIASSPHESEMLFYIKVNGDWTRKLYSLFKQKTTDTEDISIHVRGPYGAPAQHVGQYEHVVLISGGVGATPFCSITKYAHHWILNYTQRGIAASNSVSAAFTRNQSIHGTPSIPGTPTRHNSSGYATGNRQSQNPSRSMSRNQSMNFSPGISRNFSRNGSRNTSRALSPSGSGVLDRYYPGRSSGAVHSVARSPSYNGDRVVIDRPLSTQMSRPASGRLDRIYGSASLDRAGSLRTNDSVGVIIQEQRMHQPFGPHSIGSISGESGSYAPSESRLELLPIRRDGNGESGIPEGMSSPMHSVDGRIRSLVDFEDEIEDNEFTRPDDYDEELGNPELPIPDRRIINGSPSVSENRQSLFEVYDSSQVLFDEDEEHVDEEEPADVTKSGFIGDIGGVLEQVSEDGGLDLEDEILQENTPSNAYNMLGMSFGPSAMSRQMAIDAKRKRSSVVRTSINLMDDAMDANLWQDRALFYLHTVTTNWVLLWLMFIRFTLVFIGLPANLFTFNQIGLGIFKTTAMNIVDLVFAILVSVPLVGAVLMEIFVTDFQLFLSENIANSFDFFVMIPLLIVCIVLHILNLLSIGESVAHVSKLTVCCMWPVQSLFILWRITRTIGSRVVLAPNLKSTLAQTRALDYIWVSKTHEDDSWLIDELLPLAESNIIRLHRFITRHGPKMEPWMLEYEKIPLKTTYSRPDWDEVFGNLVERARSGAVIGVFFCGPDSMARMIQQSALKAMAKSMENAYQRGYFKKAGRSMARTESIAARSMAQTPMDGSIRGGLGSLQSLDGNRSAAVRGGIPAEGGKQDRPDSSAYGCSVRIAIRIENFT